METSILGIDRSKVIAGMTVGELMDLMTHIVQSAQQAAPASQPEPDLITKEEAARLLGHDTAKSTWRSVMPSYSNPDKYTETLPVHRLSFKRPMYKKEEVLHFRDGLLSGKIRPVNKLGEASKLGIRKRNSISNGQPAN